jgi:tRNA (cmo5U34)-methyltransferase
MKDTIFNKQNSIIGDFVFNKKVADVFNNMINRSVPGYRSIITMLGVLAQQYIQAGTNCYDLGSSLGAGAISIAKNIGQKKCSIIAVDNSLAMVGKCKANIKKQKLSRNIKVICDDLQSIKIENASMVVLNLTLQFVAPKMRKKIIKKIYNGMIASGVLFLTEKIAFKNKKENDFQVKSYHTFKKLKGYTDLEISQKRTALENVLIPDTIATHKQRLKECGFSNVYIWFQCFNFVSMIAVK